MLTPLNESGGVDHTRLIRHAQWLLANDVDGVAPFGTTGEGQSFSVAERKCGLDALLAQVSAERVVAATGCAALSDAIELTRHGTQAGCAACLVLPPFFFRDATDDGLFTWHARLIDGVADPRLRLILYHLPQVSGVALSIDLIERLARAFPDVIAGVKDSAGDWSNTRALLAGMPQLDVLVGHEPHLPKLMQAGGAGTICGVANVHPAAVRALLSSNVTREAEERMAILLDIVFRQPLLASFKAIVAQRTGEREWLPLRPPLLPLNDAARNELLGAWHAAGLSGAC